MVAAADVLAEIVGENDIADLHGLDRNDLVDAVTAAVEGIPDERGQCVDVCIEALRAAFAELRRRRVEEFAGERALICTCFGVSEEAIESLIARNRPTSVDEVTAACRAGGGCGSCRMLIQEMLDAREIP